jgi:hypothetical protein
MAKTYPNKQTAGGSCLCGGSQVYASYRKENCKGISCSKCCEKVYGSAGGSKPKLEFSLRKLWR